MDIAYFAQHDDLCRHSPWEQDNVSVFSAYESFLSAQYFPSVFVIGYKDHILAAALLTKLRAHRECYIKPIFLEHNLSGEASLLADGIAKSAFQVDKKADPILSRIHHINHSVTTHESDMRLLNFLYARDHRALIPLQDYHRDHGYYYPVAEAFCRDYAVTEGWLEHLCDQGVICKGKLVDRFLCCGHCQSGRMLFSDICPKCQSIDVIESRVTADCSRQEDLFPGFSMNQIYRDHHHGHHHMEHMHTERSFDCCECDFKFQEPEVIAKCMSCQYISVPDELVSKSVYRLEMTAVGFDYIGVNLRSQTRQSVRRRLKA